MAGSKKKTKTKAKAKAAKGQRHAKPAPRRAAPKKSPTKATKPARKPPPPAVRRPSPKAFAEKVRDCDAGTAIWFMVAGGIEHASIERRGNDGAIVIRTDAGVTEVVPSGNLFETADEARAARFR
jgi:hypothetical protein